MGYARGSEDEAKRVPVSFRLMFRNPEPEPEPELEHEPEQEPRSEKREG
jgi:hypothetical protein